MLLCSLHVVDVLVDGKGYNETYEIDCSIYPRNGTVSFERVVVLFVTCVFFSASK